MTGRSANEAFLDRYAGRLAELGGLTEPQSAASGPGRGMTPASRVAVRVVLAIALAGGLVALPAAAPAVDAAAPDLTISSDARYDVQPAQQRIRVTVDLLLTNHLKDTVTRRFYFDKAFLAILPDTSGFKLTWDGKGTPAVHVSKRTKDYTLVRLDLAQRLFSGKSARYRLVFYLVDPGGAPTRDVRVGDSLVSFPVWAFATDSTPGSSVEVVFPAGFSADVDAGSIPAPVVDATGRTIFQTGKLDRPLSFFAYLIADRPGAYTERTVSPAVGGTRVDLTIRSWPDDPTWSTRVGDLVGRALPVLADQIGLPWPRTGGLTVQEAVSRSTGGYAGLFDPGKGTVEVAYYADDFVVLHEAAHAWFNGVAAGRSLGERGIRLVLRARRRARPEGRGKRRAAHPGARGGQDPAQQLGRHRARDERGRGLRVRGHAGAGQGDRRACRTGRAPGRLGGRGRANRRVPATGGGRCRHGSAETVDGAPTGAGCSTCSTSRAPARSTTCGGPGSRARPTCRCSTRAMRRVTRYDAVVAEAGDWQLPRPIRDAMRAWRFDTATALFDGATRILDERGRIEAAATDRRARAAADAARRVRAPRRIRRAPTTRRPRSSPRSTGTPRRPPRVRRRRTCSRPWACGARRRTPSWPGPGRCSRRATWPARRPPRARLPRSGRAPKPSARADW